MNKFFVLNLFFFLSLTSYVLSLTVSIIIPCHYKHVQYLPELLQYFEHQTERPEEIVISVSEVGKASSDILNTLQNSSYSFKIIIIKHDEKLYAGSNRNSACSRASGDIFICQDADDIPHTQRVEIIKYFFSHHNIKHLIHNCVHSGSSEEALSAYSHSYKKENITFAMPILKLRTFGFDYITNGNIAIKKEVFQKVQWTNIPIGEDVAFNKQVSKRFKKTIIIDAYLLYYRHTLSSWAQRYKKYLLYLIS